MYLVQGAVTVALGLVTYFWMVDFPDQCENSFNFLTEQEKNLAISRINEDRRDGCKPRTIQDACDAGSLPGSETVRVLCAVLLAEFGINRPLYFLPIILHGMGFSSNKAILLSSPPYYYSVIPVLLSSYIGDKYRIRAPVIIFNALCLVVGFCMLGFPSQVTVRYIGTFLATGAYISNWAALMPMSPTTSSVNGSVPP